MTRLGRKCELPRAPRVLYLFCMRLEPVSLGFKFNVRIGHLAPDHVVEVVCPGCEHRYMVATWHLYSRFPPDTHLDTAGRYFRCRRCPRKGEMRWSIYRAVPPLSVLSR